MKIKINHLFLLLSLTLLVQVGVFLLEDQSNFFTDCLNLANFCLELLWIIILYRSSSLRKSNFKRVFYILFAFIILASLCKLQHWPIAGPLIIVSISAAMLAYQIWFLIKRRFQVSDFLKLCWVEVRLFYSLSTFQHWPFRHLLYWINIFFLLLIISFCFEQSKKQ